MSSDSSEYQSAKLIKLPKDLSFLRKSYGDIFSKNTCFHNKTFNDKFMVESDDGLWLVLDVCLDCKAYVKTK